MTASTKRKEIMDLIEKCDTDVLMKIIIVYHAKVGLRDLISMDIELLEDEVVHEVYEDLINCGK